MVEGSRIEGGSQIVSARVRKTIQSIKEIVGNHSEADIYTTLQETNMDPNETAQKLLNQDPFREVKRKRDRKKEGTEYREPTVTEPRQRTGHEVQGTKFNSYSDRTPRRGGYGRNGLPGVSREFRIVRDNRTNQNGNREMKPPASQCSTSANDTVIPNIAENSSSGTSSNLKPPGGRQSSQYLNGPTDTQPKQVRDAYSGGTDRKELQEQQQAPARNAVLRVQPVKPIDIQPHHVVPSNNSIVGVYSSSSDPVHVPTLDTRSAGNAGAIRRDFGVVGLRRSSENSVKLSVAESNSSPNSHIGRDNASRESFQSSISMSKNDQGNQTSLPESTGRSMVGTRFLSNQHNGRPYQHPMGHQKASQANKEWKPKSSQKFSHASQGVIGMPAKSVSPPADITKHVEKEAVHLQDKLSRANISENDNVIIAAHIRVSDSDRSRLTFGSLGTDFDSSNDFGFQPPRNLEESEAEASASLSVSAPESSIEETSSSKLVDIVDDHLRNSGTSSPASATVSGHELTEKKESSSPQNFDNYPDIGLVPDNSLSHTPSESQQHPDPPELPNFSAYDPQTGYDIPYFRPAVDETLRGQGLPSPQEALISHTSNSIPASTIAMVQQQQAVAQMYPQVHVSHFANLMPYRQYLSPVYVPPMAMPGYSSNPAYPHPSNGSNYLLMPGGSSHLTAGGLKYGIQQFKHVPAASPTGFGNFTSPTGYAINNPGVVGSGTGLDDSSRLKYKDSGLYVANPQAETSEIWMNSREVTGMQSASYYNMPGQTAHGAYLPSHTGHASFNPAAAVAQSSHMQFPAMYHPPQPAAIPNPHHLGPTMGGNVGVAPAAPGAQVGAYQQPQLGHLNWTGNF